MEKKNDSKNEQTPVAMDDYEKGISLHALQMKKESRRHHGSPTDDVDELIVKIAGASGKDDVISHETR